MIGGTFAATHPDRIGSAVLMNCTASAAGARQKLEYGLLLRMARLLGGVRPPLTRSVLKAFLGPTTFAHPPDVVDVRARHRAVGRRRGRGPGRCAASCPPGPTSVRCCREDLDAGSGRRGRRGRDVPAAGDHRDGRRDPDAAVAVLDGVAHLAGLENPPLVNKLIEEFVFRG